MQKRSTMTVSTSTLLALLVVIASQCCPSSAIVSVPHRSVKQPIRLDLDLKERNGEERVGILDETFKREMKRGRRQAWGGSGGLDLSFADITLSSNELTADNHSTALLYWSGEVVYILFRGFNNASGASAGSHSWRLYRSADSGVTFTNVTGWLPSTAVLDNIWPSPDPSIILFSDQLNKRIYQLHAAMGGSSSSIQLQFSPDTLLFQSSELDDAEMYGTYILGYDKKQRSLWVTNNTQNWTCLGQNVTSFFWRELNSSIEDPSTVYFDQRVNNTASFVYVANKTTYQHPQLVDPNLGAVMPNSFSLSHQYMFAQKASDSPTLQHSNKSSLWVSFYRKTFIQAKFPVDDSGKHFAVVDASEGRVMLVMYSPNLNSSALFQSDKKGTSYTLSLVNVTVASPGLAAGDGPVFDVYKVKGLPATYLANRKLPDDNFNYTYITFNSGGRWLTVNPPVIDSQRNPVECHAPCSLHLHLLTNSNELSQVLSIETAPGFIMALGNTGTHLERNASITRLYVSHDGGVHWEESAVGSGFGYFQVLDYGVYTLYVKQQQSGDTPILASCDQGRNWTVVDSLPSSLVHVSAIAVDPEATTSTKAIVYGYLNGSGQTSLGVHALNFDNPVVMVCVEDDYHLWTQSTALGLQSCVLGQRHVYERRNPETCCYIDSDYNYYVNYTQCVCGEEDYECDVGFFRKNQFSGCDPLPDMEYPPLPPAYCTEGLNYTYSSGYRKIAGDRCVGKNSSFDDRIVQPCPIVAPDGLRIVIPSQNISTFPVQSPIDFILVQLQGSQLSTLYEWKFGDNHTLEKTGLANANSTSHNYSIPNTYVVVVTATNDAGKSVAYKQITVLDIIDNVTLNGSKLVAVGTPVGYCVSVQTKLGTKRYTPAYYNWMVNGQLVPNQKSACFSWRFHDQTEANVSVSVTNALGVYNDSLCVKVAKVPAIVVVVTNGIRTVSPGDRIPANADISFSVQPSISNQTFPSDMVFHWLFVNGSDVYLEQESGSTSAFDVQFPAGDYTVTVTGNSSIGSTSSSIPISVEETIDWIHVEKLQPGYRQFTNISVFVSVFTNASNVSGYIGDVQLELWEDRNHTLYMLYSTRHSVGRNYSSLSVDYPLTVSGVHHLIFVGFNDIQSFAYKDQDVFVAGANQYEYFILIFDLDDLAENCTDNQWMVFLQANITGELMKNLGVQRWQLEVTLKEEDINITETYQFSKDVLVAHVYVLPANLSDESISGLQNATNQFLDDANNGTVAFYANESKLLVSSAWSGIDLTCQLCSKSSSRYSSTVVMTPTSTFMATAEPTVSSGLGLTSTPMETSEPTEGNGLGLSATCTPVATAEAAESNGAGLLVGLIVGLLCLVFNVVQLAVITGMCCRRRTCKRRPRLFGKGYLQMGKVEHPLEGTFAVKNESLEEQDVEDDDNKEDNKEDNEDDNEDSSEDDNEDDSREDEKAAFITKKPPPDDEESNV